jgi:hypothetical protein
VGLNSKIDDAPTLDEVSARKILADFESIAGFSFADLCAYVNALWC